MELYARSLRNEGSQHHNTGSLPCAHGKLYDHPLYGALEAGAFPSTQEVTPSAPPPVGSSGKSAAVKVLAVGLGSLVDPSAATRTRRRRADRRMRVHATVPLPAGARPAHVRRGAQQELLLRSGNPGAAARDGESSGTRNLLWRRVAAAQACAARRLPPRGGPCIRPSEPTLAAPAAQPGGGSRRRKVRGGPRPFRGGIALCARIRTRN